MSIKFTMALIVAIVCVSSDHAGSSGYRNNIYPSTSAQYCVPQYDDSDGLRIYC